VNASPPDQWARPLAGRHPWPPLRSPRSPRWKILRELRVLPRSGLRGFDRDSV